MSGGQRPLHTLSFSGRLLAVLWKDKMRSPFDSAPELISFSLLLPATNCCQLFTYSWLGAHSRVLKEENKGVFVVFFGWAAPSHVPSEKI